MTTRRSFLASAVGAVAALVVGRKLSANETPNWINVVDPQPTESWVVTDVDAENSTITVGPACTTRMYGITFTHQWVAPGLLYTSAKCDKNGHQERGYHMQVDPAHYRRSPNSYRRQSIVSLLRSHPPTQPIRSDKGRWY